ncbi:MAG: SOS response-associated peptidase family protein [bacterium]
MCGRYENAINKEELDEIFSRYIGKLNIDYDIDEVFKEENIAPTDRIKVIVLEDNVFKVKAMKWGIRSKIFDPKRKLKGLDPEFERDVFNSRTDTVINPRRPNDWQEAFTEQKCLIPLTAFYEWPAMNKKEPLRISLDNEKVFFTGGFYKKDIKGETGATILTCPPNDFMSPLHDRMPVIFRAEFAGGYLKLPHELAISMCNTLDESVKMRSEVAELLITKPKVSKKVKPEEPLTLF